MTNAKDALKAELLALYSQGLNEMLADYPEQADFAVLEEQVGVVHRLEPKLTLSKSMREGHLA